MIQAEVSARGWIATSEALVNFIAVSESTPGPFAVNIPTYVGMERAGIPGAVMCNAGRSAAIVYRNSDCGALLRNASAKTAWWRAASTACAAPWWD